MLNFVEHHYSQYGRNMYEMQDMSYLDMQYMQDMYGMDWGDVLQYLPRGDCEHVDCFVNPKVVYRNDVNVEVKDVHNLTYKGQHGGGGGGEAVVPIVRITVAR